MGVRSDLISRVYDASKYKQGKFLPGSHIEIFDPSRLSVDCPDYLLILPWNLKEEIISMVKDRYKVKTLFVVPIPSLEVLT